MSILSKSHIGAEVNFGIIKYVVMFRTEWAKMGYIFCPEIGLDKKGYYADVIFKKNEEESLARSHYLATHQYSGFNDIYFSRRHLECTDFDYFRKRHNEYQVTYENGRDLCPFFRYRNIYGNLCLDGCQKLNTLDFIDHIHGNIVLTDIPNEIIIPDNLIIDGNIRILTNRGRWVGFNGWKHISEKNRQKLYYE